MVIVESPRWLATVEELEREAELGVGEVILEVSVSVERADLVVVSRRGDSMPLAEYLERVGVNSTRRVFFSVRHNWAYPLLEKSLAQGPFREQVFGMFLDSSWLLHLNDPGMKAARRARKLDEVMRLGYIDLRGTLPEPFEGICAGVVWHPDEHDARTRADLATQSLSGGRLMYCLPHALNFISDPNACLDEDLRAMVDAGVVLQDVVPMAIPGCEKLWSERTR